MRILKGNIIDFLWKIGPKKSPGSSQKSIKNEAKLEAENCVKKSHATNAEHAGRNGNGGGFPITLRGCRGSNGHENPMDTPLVPEARWRIKKKQDCIRKTRRSPGNDNSENKIGQRINHIGRIVDNIGGKQ